MASCQFSSIPGFLTQGGITGRGNRIVCRRRSREIHILLIKIEHLKAALFVEGKRKLKIGKFCLEQRERNGECFITGYVLLKFK